MNCLVCNSEYLLDYGQVEVCMACGSVIGNRGIAAELLDIFMDEVDADKDVPS